MDDLEPDDCRQKTITTPEEFRQAVKVKDSIDKIREAISSNKDFLIEPSDGYNEIALHLACKYSRPSGEDRGDEEKRLAQELAIVKELLHGPNVDELSRSKQLKAKNAAGNTPLYVAANFGKVEIVKELLEAADGDQTLLEEQNIFKDTPVHIAASKGHVSVLKAMYEKDSKCVEFEGRFEATPLSCACGYGHLDVVEYLLDLPNADTLLNVSSIPIELPAFSKASEPREWNEDDLKQINRTKDHSSISRKHPDYTPLTRACQFGHLKVVECLLAKGARRSQLALIKAIEGLYKEIVEKLLFTDGRIQKNLLRIAYKPGNSSDSFLTTPFGELIKHMPDVAEKLLHKCVTLERFLVNAKDFKVKVDYKLVDQNIWRKDERNTEDYDYTRISNTTTEQDEEQTDAQSHKKRSRHCCKISGPVGFTKSTHPLSLMVEYKRVELLTHPLVASLMHDKWKSVYGISSSIYWLLYIMFLVITNSLLLMLPNPSFCTQANMGNASGAGPDVGPCDSNDGDGFDDDPQFSSSGANALAVVMFLYSVIRLILEFLQAVSSIYLACSPLLDHQHEKGLWLKIFRAIKGMNYFWEIVNWVEVTLFSLSTIVAIMVMIEGSCLPGWAWQIGAVVMWLSWIELIYISMQFQLIGVYALMFTRVLKTILKLVPLALLLITAFGLTFHLLIYQPQLKASPYYTRGYSLLKALSMTTGDTDTDTFFGFSYICGQTQDTAHLEYLGLSTFFWIISLVLMTVLFSNLLIGLAVGDIQSIHEEAVFEKLALQVDYILTIENQTLPCLKRFGNKDKKEFTPNEPSKWYHKILDEFIYIIWGGTRYDSWESIQRLITYIDNEKKSKNT